MTSGYRSEQDRDLIERYFRVLDITSVRQSEIGYDLEEEYQVYLFIAREKDLRNREELTIRVVHVYDDGGVESYVSDYPENMKMAQSVFVGKEMDLRNVLTFHNGRYRSVNGPGVPKGYQQVLQDVLFAFQVGDYQIVEVDGRPAVQFSIYSCDPEYALEDYHAEFDRDRMTYTVFLDDPHGTGKVKAPPKKKDKPAKTAPRKTSPDKPKEKPERKSTKSASDVQSRRSTRAQTLDSKRRAKKTFPADYTDEQYVLWAANPGRYDIEGIDTPARVGSAQRRSSKGRSVDLSAAKVGDVVWCSDNRIWSVSIVRKGMNGSSPTLAVTDAAKGERYTFKLATNGRVTSDDTERRVPDYVRGVVESVLKQMRRVSKGSRR